MIGAQAEQHFCRPPLSHAEHLDAPASVAMSDLDGTLIDSAPDITAAVNKLLTRYGRPAISVEQVRGMVGDGAPILLRRAFAATGADIDPMASDEIYQTFLDYYERQPSSLDLIFPGVPKRWTSCWIGASLGLCTNKPERVTVEVLAQLDLAAFSSPSRVATPCPCGSRTAAMSYGLWSNLAPRPTARSWLEITTTTSRRRAVPASR